MADDSIKVYDWALGKNSEILISGYYGFKNSGDDALLKAIIQDLKTYKESPNIVVLSANPNIVVLSANPKETMSCYKVRSVNRLNIFKIMKHMGKAELLISGGGTLIQDRTSTKSLWYYLTIISLALRLNMRVMLYSNGIGPLEKKKNILKTKKILDKVDLITLRDERSYNTLKEIGVDNENVIITADPALELDVADENRGREILEAEGVNTGEKLLGVSIRRWQSLGTEFEESVARACDYAYEKYGYYAVFTPMQSSRDTAIMQSIRKKMKYDSSIISKRYSVEDVMSLTKCFGLCIGMRLHTLIYAVINSVPLIGIAYDPKISSFMEYTHQTHYIDVANVTFERLKTLLDECEASYDEIKDDLKENYIALRDQARLNGKYAIELYEKGSVDA